MLCRYHGCVFAIANLAKLVSFSMLGPLKHTIMLARLILTPVAVLRICAGNWLNHRLNVKLLYRFAYIILFVIGARLVYTSLKGLL